MSKEAAGQSNSVLRRILTEWPVFRRFPLYVWLCLAAMYAVQMPAFSGTQLLLPLMPPPHDLTTALDLAIPFSAPWIAVYYLAFISWPVSCVWILSESKARGYRFAAAYILNLLISAAIFLCFPCTMERPQVTGTDLFSLWVRFTYFMDNPVNLFPSLHVAFSYFCWRGTLGCRRIPLWYKWFNFVFLLLVCCSIIFVKQHVVWDIPPALAVGEATLQLARLLRLERIGFAVERARSRKKEGGNQNE
jgi:hypothetical protein